MRNYNRDFYGQPKLASPQKMVAYGDLKCIHGGGVFCHAWVDSYNQYTNDFNKASDRAGQEYMLDQRHSFYMVCCSILNDSKDAPIAA